MKQLTLFALSLSFCLSLTIGCGDGLPKRVPVSGEVKLDGQLVPNAKVTFIPADGSRVANGLTDENGVFTHLGTFKPKDGAIIGSHQVAITPKNPPPMPGDEISSPGGRESRSKYVSPIPSKYGIPSKSGLSALVESGEKNHFIFELKSK